MNRMEQNAKVLLVYVVAISFSASGALGAIITSPGDTALDGATVIDFESQTMGTYVSLGIGDVTFTADDNHLRIDNTYAGQYSTLGISLDNGTYGDNGFSSMTIGFAGPVSAFGFNWGAAEPWSNWLVPTGVPLKSTSNCSLPLLAMLQKRH